MKNFLAAFFFLAVFGAVHPAYAQSEWGTYFGNMGRNLNRGLVNMLSSPLEVPIGIQKAHESAGLPILRHTEGFVEGSMGMFKRFGSGVWDWTVCWVPTDQDGLPPTPETLF